MSYTAENLKEKDRRALKIIAKEVAASKSLIPGYEKANKLTQVKNQNKLIKNLNDIYGVKFKMYKIMNEDDFKPYKTNDRLIELILDIQKLEKVTEEEHKRGGSTGGIGGLGRSKFAENADAIMDDIQKKSQGPITKEIKEQIVGGFDKLLEIDRKDESDETKARAKESGEIVLEIIGDLFKKETKIEAQEELINSFTYIVDRIPVVRVEETDILEDTDALQEMTRRNRETQAQMGKALLKARKLRDEMEARAVKNPAVDMEEKQEEEEPVKIAPSGEMVSGEKAAGKQKQKQKEEPYIPLPVVGTDYQGSKEMFVKQEQKPLEPFGGLQSQNEVEAPYLSTKSDKDIGNVRSVGFVGAMDQLAKVEDVTMEPSERSKSLKRFTNFRWVQSVQNSDLGYASPFQRMDDIDDRRRFGKCFMHANKIPKDPDTQDELDKAKGFNTYSLVPSFDLSSRMQPATPLSFINSTSKFARKVTGDEMEPINQGKRNVSNLKNKLEFTTLLHSDDPLMRIKDKYKNNIVC
jgi:hypothetical protein